MNSGNLTSLAQRLLASGPVKTAPTPRRVRLLFNGTYIADTTAATHVWEHKYYPQFYLPTAAFSAAKSSGKLSTKPGEEIKAEDGSVGAQLYIYSVGDQSTERVIQFADKLSGAAAPLAGTVRVDFGAMDQWFEEDTPIFVHPKDPFKRVDILPSSRPVEVKVGGRTVAKTVNASHLYETGLPVRYYLPPTSLDQSLLRPSKTTTKCPYKGMAEYYDVVVDGKTFKDVVWYYRNPILECANITGLVCFYNEKVETWVDGVKEEKPDSIFA